MNIHNDHLYHGAALIQIAEHPRFTAINSLRNGKRVYSVAYKINDEIALYLKYAADPTPSHQEYVFQFRKSNLHDLDEIAKANPKTFIALVCVQDREICCISYRQLIDLVRRRKEKRGKDEGQYTVLTTARKGERLRLYMNDPGRKNTILGSPIIVPRSDFPDVIFRKD
ncbi:hypothetical protein ACI2TF_04360 [Ralstonia nicotianae]